jgi:membrane peptidoglycan carboxypeptidase
MKDGRERIVRLFPGSGTFTSIESISPYMVAAVLTTEDGGFFRHRGFLPSQFEEAMRRNLKAGAIRLGASTITMQMVKNVMLSHERTLSRKLQEMFLTWYVEQSLSKERIMEIYLNVVELAPGIYGITRAAEHYFGKHPSELNPLESVYLALMLPSPVRRHAHYCRGQLSARMDSRLRRIFKIMHDRNRITTEEYETWKDADLIFDATDRGDTQTCLAEIDRLMGADEGQRALTGLLAPPAGPGVLDPDLDPDLDGLRELPSLDDDFDPANSDAPGRPAMDEERRPGEEPP